MITTKAVLVKFDHGTLDRLNEECDKFGRKRNRVINIAVDKWLRNQDEERDNAYWRSVLGDSSPSKGEAHEKYILSELPWGVVEEIPFICGQLGMDVKTFMAKAVERAVDDFKKRPFSYL